MSSSSLLADRGIGEEDAQAGSGSVGARGADAATGLGSGRSTDADERASSDAVVDRSSGGELPDKLPRAGAAGLNSAETAARADGVQAAAGSVDTRREQVPRETVAAQDIERAARQSAERAADVEAARGQGAGAARDPSRIAEAGSSTAGGSTAVRAQDSILPETETEGSTGASGSMQQERGSQGASAARNGGAGIGSIQVQSAGAVQGAEMSTGQALSGIAADSQNEIISSRSRAARLLL